MRIFLRDVGRLLRWGAPSRHIALPMIQRMRCRARSGYASITFAERYAMVWLLIPDIIVGAWICHRNTGCAAAG